MIANYYNYIDKIKTVKTRERKREKTGQYKIFIVLPRNLSLYDSGKQKKNNSYNKNNIPVDWLINVQHNNKIPVKKREKNSLDFHVIKRMKWISNELRVGPSTPKKNNFYTHESHL